LATLSEDRAELERAFALPTIATVGVDIGQKRDHSAIAVVQPEKTEPELGDEWRLIVRRLNRLPLGTDFDEVARVVAETVSLLATHLEDNVRRQREVSNRFHSTYGHSASLYEAPIVPSVSDPLVMLRVDATGMGLPVVGLILRHIPDALLSGHRPTCRVRSCYFTHGDRLTHKGSGEATVGKAYLVSRLKALFQSRLLKMPEDLREGRAMLTELLDFERDVDPDANERYGAFRVGTHDDLVTALGLAVIEDPYRPPRALVGSWSNVSLRPRRNW
jgi:hypothetical protein